MVTWIFAVYSTAHGWRVWLKSLSCQKPSNLDALVPLVLSTRWEAPGFGAHPMSSMASRDACKHHCLFPHPYIVVSLEGNSSQGGPTLCVFQKFLNLGNGWTIFSLWLVDISSTGWHLSCWHGCPQLLTGDLKSCFEKMFWQKVYWKLWCQQGVKYEIGQEADRNGNEGTVSAQGRIPSLCKQKTRNTRLNKGKFSHCGYKHFTRPICCIEYSRDFGIEPIYQIASSLLFVRSLGTINEGDWGIWINVVCSLYGVSLPFKRVSINYYPLCKLVCFFMRR